MRDPGSRTWCRISLRCKEIGDGLNWCSSVNIGICCNKWQRRYVIVQKLWVHIVD